MYKKSDFMEYSEVEGLLFSENKYDDCDILCCGKKGYELSFVFDKNERITEILIDREYGDTFKSMYEIENPKTYQIDEALEKFSYICDTFLND